MSDAQAENSSKLGEEQLREQLLLQYLVDACVASDAPAHGLSILRSWLHDVSIAQPGTTSAPSPDVACHESPIRDVDGQSQRRAPTRKMLTTLLHAFARHARANRLEWRRVNEVRALARHFALPIYSAEVLAYASLGGVFTPQAMRALHDARAAGSPVSRAAELVLMEACLEAGAYADAEAVLDVEGRGIRYALEIVGALQRKRAHAARQAEIREHVRMQAGNGDEMMEECTIPFEPVDPAEVAWQGEVDSLGGRLGGREDYPHEKSNQRGHGRTTRIPRRASVQDQGAQLKMPCLAPGGRRNVRDSQSDSESEVSDTERPQQLPGGPAAKPQWLVPAREGDKARRSMENGVASRWHARK